MPDDIVVSGNLAILPSGMSLMIATRPASVVAGEVAPGVQRSFVPAQPHETFHPTGQNTRILKVPRTLPLSVQRRHEALVRVKSFLQDLAMKKSILRNAKTEEEERINANKSAFAENQRILRQIILSGTHPGDMAFDDFDNDKKETSSRAYAYLSASSTTADSGHNDSIKQPIKKDNRPAWARHADSVISDDENEDELLDFASSLDFKQYENDLESGASVALMKKGLSELEEQEKLVRAELSRLEAQQERERVYSRPHSIDDPHATASIASEVEYMQTIAKQSVQHERKKSYNYFSFDTKNEANEDLDDCISETESVSSLVSDLAGQMKAISNSLDASSVAESVLSTASSIRGIHSKTSLLSVIKKIAVEERKNVDS